MSDKESPPPAPPKIEPERDYGYNPPPTPPPGKIGEGYNPPPPPPETTIDVTASDETRGYNPPPPPPPREES